MNRGLSWSVRVQRIAAGIALAIGIGAASAPAQGTANEATAQSCRVETTNFDGWQAQKMTNRWLELIFVPKIGGRLMQVIFAGHPYLFVNPKYRGQYFPPEEGTRKWFNYGGDKIWPMPEGSADEGRWPGPIADFLDDGDYAFRVVSQGAECMVRMEGPTDETTGLQYTREISVSADSPEISFRAIMKNATNHPIRWSVQSVTQYDTADTKNPATFNHDFWAFTRANEHSAYLDAYHVRSGLAEDPSFEVNGGIFRLHWLDVQSEVWVDSTGGWVAVVDGASRYAMVERFQFDSKAEYPGKATVIFYKNGPGVEVDANGVPTVHASDEDTPFYMEAELNSPMVRMAAGESYTFSTKWFPTRAGAEFKTVTNAGVVGSPLTVMSNGEGMQLSGGFGVFYAGKLVAKFVTRNGKQLRSVPVKDVDPTGEVNLSETVRAPAGAGKLAVHLIDVNGKDRGVLGEAEIRQAGSK